MKVLDLFAGSCSVGEACSSLGFDYYASDIMPFEGIHQVCDIFDFDIKKVPFVPNVVWASVPCPLFSQAKPNALSIHWKKCKSKNQVRYIPISDDAHQAYKILLKTIDIINSSGCDIFYIENPLKGRMRHMKEMRSMKRIEVSYLDYGFDVWKPTAIFSNDLAFKPIKMKNQFQINGVKKVTNKSNSYERSKVPPLLIQELLLSAHSQIFPYSLNVSHG